MHQQQDEGVYEEGKEGEDAFAGFDDGADAYGTEDQ